MNYRNKKLLQAAEDCPNCMGCGKPNDGTIVASHSNQIRDGKGTGIKSQDYRVAYLCHACHNLVDAGRGSREERLQFWEMAHRNTVAYWFENGIVRA